MKTYFTSKFLSWLVLALLLINALTLGLFWFGKPKGSAFPKERPQDFLIEQLKFTEKQKEAYLLLMKDHRNKTVELRDAIREKKDALFALAKIDSLSESSKLQVAKEVSSLTEQLDLLTLEHFHAIRTLCDNNQKETFDKILKEVTAMMGAPRPQGPHGPPPPPPGAEPRPE